ncbi:hypothetical protein HJC23_008494 [Cyclotella cryptica]|uniref:HECT-type E3 ubiquitin transferase n=1 Tax=Cyclotella cryptica TaxID=29204 RepID=A0ABD3QWR6_9STRA
MFDGSFRTNRREINLAGRSSTRSTTRTSHLHEARQQRLARAAAKAKTNAACVLQRCWRGVRGGLDAEGRGRKGIAAGLNQDFHGIAEELIGFVEAVQNISQHDEKSVVQRMAQKQHQIRRLASLMAFRLSPALIPFFASNGNGSNDVVTAKCVNDSSWDKNNALAEECIRRDFLSLDYTLRFCYGDAATAGTDAFVSPVAAKRLVVAIIILLRQSFHFQNSSTQTNHDHDQADENLRLVRLVNYLLEKHFVPGGNWALSYTTDDFWTFRPSDYFLTVLNNVRCGRSASSDGGWLINLFSCFRDSYLLGCDVDTGNREDAAPMEVDVENSGREEVQMILLKWCCRVILHLATMDQRNGAFPNTEPFNESMLSYQKGLSLLGSIIFLTDVHPSATPTWMNDQLLILVSSLEQYVKSNSRQELMTEVMPSTSWSSLFVFFLAHGLNALSRDKPNEKNTPRTQRSHVPGIMKLFSYSSSLQSSDPWIGALADTLTLREHVVMENVLSYADICRSESPQTQHVFLCSIPMILRYALEHQYELSILSNYAALGDDIMGWISSSATKIDDSVTSNALSKAAVKAFDEDESESDSDDAQVTFQQQSNQLQNPMQSNNRADYSGRYSRADLQTMPKLDSLYQTFTLQTKKQVMDKLQLNVKSRRVNEMRRFALASKIGRGGLMQQVGESLFSLSTTTSYPRNALLSTHSPVSWQNNSRECYASCLAAIMTSCSGLKAGKNALSPLLAKLAFHDSLLYGMWDIAKERAYMITSSLSTASSLSTTDMFNLSAAYGTLATFCDMFSHNLLAVDDDLFLHKYHHPIDEDATNRSSARCLAKELVVTLKIILNDLYWVRPVLASDLSWRQTFLHDSSKPHIQQDADASVRFQRARLLLSGTKLWNSLYERWCRLYRNVQFCDETCWWFPQLSYRGQHDNNPIIHSQITSVGQSIEDDDAMDESIDDGERDTAAASSVAANNDAGMDALATSFRDPKMARVLTCIPQALPFNRRVDLFQNLLESDKLRTQDETAAFRQMMMNFDSDGGMFSGREKVTIRRDYLYADSMNTLMPLGKKLRKKLQVTFVNKHGVEEAGIDGGGVQKEFFDGKCIFCYVPFYLIKDAFLPAQHSETSDDEPGSASAPSHPDFFVETPIQTLQVNTALTSSEHIRHYEFLGRVLGKTMYESILVEPQFSLPFLNKLLGKQNSLDDLKNLDPEYYKHLKSLRYMSARDIIDLGLTFEVTTSSLGGNSHSTIELIPGGSKVPVTKENVIQYIHLVSHQRMNVAGARQTAAFLHGFREIIPAPWVRLFSAYEFQKIISGDDTVKGIDVQGMMSVMRYSGGFHPSQPIIQWLWEVVDEMTPEQQRKFLRFMTSCSRQPLLGFGSLIPAPCVQQTRLREDDYGNEVSDESSVGNIRLPTSATCMNLLKLPKYPNKAMLKEKLLYAIECGTGFELS